MHDWTAGYVADITYTHGYYHELNPYLAKLPFLNVGIAPPPCNNACELGFGQGLSVNIHAAATQVEWYGTDFNPVQAGFAGELTEASASGAKLFDQSFADFAQRDDLPQFDFIGVHGIWSWINDENRAIIVDLVRRKLKVGGVLYVSYNTLPGRAAFSPVRHLMKEHADRLGASGLGVASRIDGALEFMEKLFAVKPTYAVNHPLLAEQLRVMKAQNRQYLAHEYFNRDWCSMHFATMAEWLMSAKLSYACSAHYPDHLDVINLTTEQADFLRSIPDQVLRESTRDFITNQQFRRDYWVKGPRKMTMLEQSEALRNHRVILVAHRQDIVLKVKGALGEAAVSDEIYNPILDLLADHKPRMLGEIELALRNNGVGLPQLMQAIMVLSSMKYLADVQDEQAIQKSKKHTDKLNRHLINKARSGSEVTFLASPVTGGGISVGRFQQLFLLAISQGKKNPVEWVKATWEILMAQNHVLFKNEKALQTSEENISELSIQAQAFAEKSLPILRALQVA